MKLSDYEKDKTLKEGVPMQNIPTTLKSVLHDIKLLQPSQKPGVYGIFFPTLNQIYIGQSSSVSREISMYRTSQRTQIMINLLFKEHAKTALAFSIYQGEKLKDPTLRRTLESLLIEKTIKININVQSTPRFLTTKPSDLANSLFLQTTIIEGPLTEYDLDLVGHEPPRDQSCIYLFINPKTKNFYIGETTNFYTANVMKRHRVNIYGYKKRKAENIHLTSDKTIEKIVADLTESKNVLLFTALKNLDCLPKKERLQQETFFKQNALNLYKNRLYNAQNFTPKKGYLSQTSESKELIRQSSLARPVTQDLTQYPCICEGKWYNNRSEASKAYGYKSPDGLKYKLANPQEKDFIWLKDTKNKPIPNDPEIQKKIIDFFKNLKVLPKRIIER